jgi:hypothetical protein
MMLVLKVLGLGVLGVVAYYVIGYLLAFVAAIILVWVLVATESSVLGD